MDFRIGDILVAKGFITRRHLDEAIVEQNNTKKMLGEILIQKGLITERTLLKILSDQQGIPFIELSNIKVGDHILRCVPAKFVRHYKIMPIRLEGGVLTVAISNPFDMWPLDDLEINLGYRTEKVLAVSSDIHEAINKYYGVGAETIEKILDKNVEGSVEVERQKDKKEIQDLEKMAEDASVVKLVSQILRQAVSDRATDIHIEQFENEAVLRYRIDGVLYDTPVSEDIKFLYPSIISRIKVMSGLDIIERRLPQDGRARIKIGDKDYDLRISVIPTLNGENIVIRILPAAMLFHLSDLGMTEQNLAVLERLIKKPHGIIFVTGPTGSGKTTTLYACLSKLNTRQRKIITIEDPIEYGLKGVSQININSKISLTFSKSLRSVLRHDPDVIMVGEVRDTETAQITIQTALTGHLVFSTLHTNDAASSISRLIDMEIDPFLIASSVEAFVAQRLVRVICDKCRQKVELSHDELNRLSAEGFKCGGKDKYIYRGAGCKECNNVGYKGRTGIYEILLVDEDIKKLIMQKTPSNIIKQKAIEKKMETLRQNGWCKVMAGVTTPEEVIRVTQEE